MTRSSLRYLPAARFSVRERAGDWPSRCCSPTSRSPNGDNPHRRRANSAVATSSCSWLHAAGLVLRPACWRIVRSRCRARSCSWAAGPAHEPRAIPPGFVDEFTDTVNKRKFKEALDMARNDAARSWARCSTAGMSRLQYGLEDGPRSRDEHAGKHQEQTRTRRTTSDGGHRDPRADVRAGRHWCTG